MQKFYLIAVLFTITSCATRVNYIGNTGTPTEKVDVYVTESSIKKPYDVMGRGFVDMGGFSVMDRRFQETLQRKAIQKAKSVGADAVLIQEFILVAPGTNINTVYRTDTLNKGVVTVGNTSIGPNISNGLNIFFLKYSR